MSAPRARRDSSRRGGRISLAEPIFQDEAFFVRAPKSRIDARVPGGDNRFLRLLHRWRAAQFPDSLEAFAKNPLVNYFERDLVIFVRACGFNEIHLQLQIDVMPSPVTSWERLPPFCAKLKVRPTLLNVHVGVPGTSGA